MKIYLVVVMIICLTGCTQNLSTKSEEEPVVPALSISGHYFEGIKNDPETMRRGMEIELIVVREKGPIPQSTDLIKPVSSEQSNVKEAFRLLAEEAVVLKSKLSMELFGCGGLFTDSIDSLEIVVSIPRQMDIVKARLVFVAVLRDWLKRLNEDMGAKPYYKVFPMTIENLEFRMMLGSYDVRSSAKDPKIALVFNIGNQVFYCYREKNGGLTSFYKESYSEALNATLELVKTNGKT